MATGKATQDQIKIASQTSYVQRDYNYLTLAAEQGARYRECRRNHAASLGKHATDGCGEFLKAGEDGSEKAFLCAACGCHRSFHRMELLNQQHHHVLPPPPMMLTTPVVLYNSQVGSGSKRTFTEEKIKEMEVEKKKMKANKRAKFSPEQKNKMKMFAEKIGWRSQKHDEEEIDKFCNEIGISQKIFKGWVNNNRRRPEPCSVASISDSDVSGKLNIKDQSSN